jgi:membrane protein YdbS with pleckstrin-like domain
VSPRLHLENGETLVVEVTPVAQGIIAPLSLVIVLEGLVIWGSTQWSFLHHREALALFVVGVLPALVILTRSWRWRSHKITVTTQRIIVEGGVLGRHSTQVNLGDVFATHADQSLSERLRRRGVVLLETHAGTVMLGPVRHPTALRRLVDRTRRDFSSSQSPTWDDWLDDQRPSPPRRKPRE